MKIAITRKVAPTINKCELTHLVREEIDPSKAHEQHLLYEKALLSLGVKVVSLPAEPDYPDSVFVEDTALVLDDCAIMTNPGATTRRGEIPSIEAALAPYRKVFRIQPSGTLDGGDILTVEKTIFIGLSSRSCQNAIDQVRNLVMPFGYSVQTIPLTGCLHLKSAVTQVGKELLLINTDWVNPNDFQGLDYIEIDPAEPSAANAVLIDDTIIFPSDFPKTMTRIKKAGIRIEAVDADELAKAEGAVTCCSILFEE